MNKRPLPKPPPPRRLTTKHIVVDELDAKRKLHLPIASSPRPSPWTIAQPE